MTNSFLGRDLDPNHQVCTRCIYDDRVSSITFDSDGVCNYCGQLDELVAQYGTGRPEGAVEFERLLDEIKAAGRGKKYDCIIGVSGGTDSSYMVHQAINEWGLRPLAVHYDNTWNSAISTQNIAKVLNPLGVDLYTHVVDNTEVDDIYRSFFLASIAEIDSPTDLAFAEVMYRAARKYRVKYVFEGHSFVEEGIVPVGRGYFDGRYIQSVHKLFGTRRMSSYPLMTFQRFLFWTIFARIKKIRPFWYTDYSKQKARDILEKEYGWEYYGGHHLENRITTFAHSVYLPEKFDTDMRNSTLSALVRNGKVTRENAWHQYNQPPHVEEEIIRYFRKRLGLSQDEYDKVMLEPPRSWHEFPTYKKRFERMRPIFKMLSDANLVPRSFYLKYCFPAKMEN